MTKKEPSWDDADAPRRIKDFGWYCRMAKKYLFGLRGEGYEILRMKDVKEEWNFIIARIDEYLEEKEKTPDTPPTLEMCMNGLKGRIYSKVVVNFYHDPKDTEEPFIVGNRELIRRGFRILWVYNSKKRSDFESELTSCMTQDTLRYCRFLKMDDVLKLIPINFTVIAPHDRALPLVYVRFDDLDCAIRIESRGPTVSLFDDLGCHCIEKVPPQNSEQKKWIPILPEG